MTTTNLINALREAADTVEYPEMEQVMREAADRLEEMEERLDIMRESMDENWGKNYS